MSRSENLYRGVASGSPPSTGIVAPVVGVRRVAKKSTALATLNTVVVAPMPSERVRRVAAVKPGVRRKARMAYPMSWRIDSMAVLGRFSDGGVLVGFDV